MRYRIINKDLKVNGRTAIGKHPISGEYGMWVYNTEQRFIDNIKLSHGKKGIKTTPRSKQLEKTLLEYREWLKEVVILGIEEL